LIVEEGLRAAPDRDQVQQAKEAVASTALAFDRSKPGQRSGAAKSPGGRRIDHPALETHP
jgi:hypothetical protein